MAVEVGSAYVSLVASGRDLGKQISKDITGDLDGVGSDAGDRTGHSFMRSFGSKIATLGQVVGAGLAVAAGGAALFVKDAVGAASDLQESMSKVDIVFGESAGSIQEWAKSASKNMGLSKAEALGAAGTFGNLFRSMGLGTPVAAEMSTNLTQLAGDMGAFNNVPTTDALDALRSGLVGETEPLKRFGVNINDARLKAEALRLGLVSANVDQGKFSAATEGVDKASRKVGEALAKYGEGSVQHTDAVRDAEQANTKLAEVMEGKLPEGLDATTKALAANSLIFKDTAVQQGNYVDTAGDYAGSLKTLSSTFEDFKATAGTALLPIVTKIVQAMTTQLLPALASVGPKVKELGGRIVEFARGVDFGAVLAAVTGFVGPLIGRLKDIGGSALEVGKALVQLGKAAFPTIIDAVNVALPLLRTLHETTLLGIKTALDVLAPVLRFVARNFDTIKVVLAPLVAGLVAYKAVTLAVTTAQQIAATVTKAMAAAQWVLNAAMSANPIGLVIAGIAALVAGFILAYQHSETFRAIIDAIGRVIMTGLKAAIDWIVNTAVPAIVGFATSTYNAISSVVQFFVDLPGNILGALGDIGSWLIEQGKALIGGLLDGIKVYFEVVKLFYVDLPLVIIGFFADAARWLFDKGMDIVRGLWDGAKAMFVNFANFMVGIRDAAIGFVGDAAGWLYDKGRDIIQGLVNGISAWVNFQLQGALYLADKVRGFVGDAASWLYNAGRDVVQGLIDGIGAMAGVLRGAVSGLAGQVTGGFRSALGIGSPSTVMMRLGADTMDGYVLGIIGGRGNLAQELQAITGMIAGTAPRAGASLGFDLAPVAGGFGGGAPQQTFNIHGANLTARDVGNELAWTMRTLGAA